MAEVSLAKLPLDECHRTLCTPTVVRVMAWSRTQHVPFPGGGTRVHRSRVGSAGLRDLKILHVLQRLKKGVKILQRSPNARNGGQYSTSVWKICRKRSKKSAILKNIGVKILKIDENGGQNSKNWWKWGSKFHMAEKQGSKFYNAWKRGSICYIWPLKVGVKILHKLKKGGQKGRAYPLPQT